MKNTSKFKFQTKSETLKFLKKRVKESKIENIFDFTIEDWNHDKVKILQIIRVKFNSKIIVRSSAEGEDSIEKSEAGSYESILNVDSNSKKDVQKAISMVIQSYELQGNKYDEFKKKYGSCHEKPVIPKTWNMKYDNCNKTDGKIIFSGPIDNIIEVMNSINYFYQGFNYTIT